MIDQNQQLNLSPSDEVGGELEKRDVGEAAEVTKLNPEEKVENMVEANYEEFVRLRQMIIESDAISREEADNFQIIDSRPKARDIIREYDEVAEELATPDEQKTEREELKIRQAKLLLELDYNVTALFQTHYVKKTAEDMFEIYREAKSAKPEAKEQVKAKVQATLSQMGKISVELETVQKSCARLVPDLVRQYPELQSTLVALNGDLLKCYGRQNQFKDDGDQPQQELGRFIEEFKQKFSTNRIQRLQARFDYIFSNSESTEHDLGNQPNQLDEAVEIKSEGEGENGETAKGGKEEWLPDDDEVETDSGGA